MVLSLFLAILLGKEENFELSIDITSQGSLLASGYLTETIEGVPEWNAPKETDLDYFGAD